MFDKFMGGQLVQMVEYRQGDLLYRAKKATPIGPDQALRVAGLNGKKTKVVAAVTCARPLEGGDFLCVAQVHDLAQQRELSKLCPASANPDSKLRQHPRNERKVEITCNDRAATSIDISEGGLQVETEDHLEEGQVLSLKLMEGLTCQARVAWVKGTRAGLEFQEVDDATKILLTRFASGRIIPTASKPPKRLKVIAPPDYHSLSE
ncbi:MAG TPA: PilZ domain-containing protein [Phycisphaerales bacterium]|nr:PilZ domain-containing protein [Phycisphaerales bacterium]